MVVFNKSPESQLGWLVISMMPTQPSHKVPPTRGHALPLRGQVSQILGMAQEGCSGPAPEKVQQLGLRSREKSVYGPKTPTNRQKQKHNTQQHPGMEGLAQDGLLVVSTVSLLLEKSPS